jgi:hypothetical protein
VEELEQTQQELPHQTSLTAGQQVVVVAAAIQRLQHEQEMLEDLLPIPQEQF